MNGRKNVWIMFGFVLSVSLMVSALSVLTVSGCYSRLQFNLLNSVCSEILEQEPGTEQVLSAALKASAAGISDHAAKGDILTGLGYRISDFASLSYRQSLLCAAAGFLAGTLLFILTFFVRNKKENRRIRAVTEYLEQVNFPSWRMRSTRPSRFSIRRKMRQYRQKTVLQIIYGILRIRSRRRSRPFPFRCR